MQLCSVFADIQCSPSLLPNDVVDSMSDGRFRPQPDSGSPCARPVQQRKGVLADPGSPSCSHFCAGSEATLHECHASLIAGPSQVATADDTRERISYRDGSMPTQSLVTAHGSIHKAIKRSIAQINRRVALARERAQKAAAHADNTALSENNQLVSVGVKKQSLVSTRMSSKGFAAKDPQLALIILRLMHVDAMHSYTFDMLELTCYKYHVSSLAQKLVDASVYPGWRSASMPATQAMRYLYEVALEVGDDSTRELLCWNTAQQMLQGRESRGVGIVATNGDAKAFLATALAMCVERVEKCVEAAEEYKRCMDKTANACC